MTGLIGLKVSFLAQNYVTVRQMTTHMRPTSATVWSNQLETSAFFAQPPGLVPTTTFPPPPPPYSQINQSPSATSPNPNQRTSPAAVASAPPDYELIIRVDQPNRLNDSVLPH
ncbi:unnamed protein product [Anisakis simplex]|uniref:Uncharacterized protein n=1 Tax=Anisakis simplex TaxID=6269 RepID=A0A0M3KHS4_ANISI|nr:unnamed protein product [Anisakis simplex]